jgi:hypothetical protein
MGLPEFIRAGAPIETPRVQSVDQSYTFDLRFFRCFSAGPAKSLKNKAISAGGGSALYRGTILAKIGTSTC